MNKSLLALAIASVGLFISGCNSDSDSDSASSNNTAIDTFQFIDETVKGVYYETASKSHSGCTDANGNYSVPNDEKVYFSLGVCDGDNNPTLTDNKVALGYIDNPSKVTTPFDLNVDANTTVDPIAVAQVLKSLNSTNNADKLDVSGVLFNSNGEDIRNDLEALLSSPATDSDAALNAALFTKLLTANSSKAAPLLETAFVDSATAKSELNQTMQNIAQITGKEVVFTEAIINGKTVKAPNDVTYTFGSPEPSSYAYFDVQGMATIVAKDGTSSDKLWGIFSSDDPNSLDQFRATAGDLYIRDGIVLGPIDINAKRWLVSVDYSDGKGVNTETWVIVE